MADFCCEGPRGRSLAPYIWPATHYTLTPDRLLDLMREHKLTNAQARILWTLVDHDWQVDGHRKGYVLLGVDHLVADLAERGEIPQRTVEYALAKLDACGLIERRQRGKKLTAVTRILWHAIAPGGPGPRRSADEERPRRQVPRKVLGGAIVSPEVAPHYVGERTSVSVSTTAVAEAPPPPRSSNNDVQPKRDLPHPKEPTVPSPAALEGMARCRAVLDAALGRPTPAQLDEARQRLTDPKARARWLEAQRQRADEVLQPPAPPAPTLRTYRLPNGEVRTCDTTDADTMLALANAGAVYAGVEDPTARPPALEGTPSPHGQRATANGQQPSNSQANGQRPSTGRWLDAGGGPLRRLQCGTDHRPPVGSNATAWTG